MSEAKKDENHEKVGLAYDETNETTEPLLVDPITDRLEIVITEDGGAGGTPVSIEGAPRDDNHVPIIMGVTDDANETVVPILTDDNGLILCDILGS